MAPAPFRDCECPVPLWPGRPWDFCQRYDRLVDSGMWTFEVRMVLLDGQGAKRLPLVATAPAQYTWETDFLAPVVHIVEDGAPPPCSVAPPAAATFEVVSNEPVARLECRLGLHSAFAPCPVALSLTFLHQLAWPATELAHGLTTLAVRAVDVAGNRGPPALYTWFVDRWGPHVSLDPAGPVVHQQTGAVRVAFVSELAPAEFQSTVLANSSWLDHRGQEHNCAQGTQFQLLLDGFDITPRNATAWGPRDQGVFADNWDQPDTDTFAYFNYADGQLPTVAQGTARTFVLGVRALDPAGNLGPPAQLSLVLDRRAPRTAMTRVPPPLVPAAQLALVDWLTDEANSPDDPDPALTYVCQLDGQAPEPCVPPWTVPSDRLADGEHTLAVTAQDQAGNEAPADQPVHWLVDRRPPQARFVGTPPVPSPAVRDPSFLFVVETDEAGGAFEVLLYQQIFGYDNPQPLAARTVATAPLRAEIELPPLVDDAYRLDVWPLDRAGNRGQPLIHAWTIDRQPPAVLLSPPPAYGLRHLSGERQAEFGLASTEPGRTRLFCALDCLREWLTCQDVQLSRARLGAASPFATMSTLCVGVDAHPTDLVAVFSGGGGSTATAECRDSVGTIANATFFACQAPLRIHGLAEGRHVLQVTVEDRAGNRGAVVQYGWRVDTTWPTASVAAGPQPLTRESEAGFMLSADESLVQFMCRLQQGSLPPPPFAACAENLVLSNLSDGAYELHVYAVDQVGNVQARVDINGQLLPSFTTWSWRVDRQAPSVRLHALDLSASDNSSMTRAPAVTVAVDVDEDVLYWECRTAPDAPFSLCQPRQQRLFVYNTRQQPTVASSLTPVRLCAAALLAGCGPEDLYADSQRLFCPLGLLALCGLDAPSGPRWLQVRAYDRAGNQGAPATLSWQYDHDAPIIANLTATGLVSAGGADVVRPFGNGSTAGTMWLQVDRHTLLTASWQADAADVAHFDCQLLSNVTVDVSACEPPLHVRVEASHADGLYAVRVRAVDRAGNPGPWAELVWTRDTQLPTVTFGSSWLWTNRTDTTMAAFVCSEPDCQFSCRVIPGSNLSAAGTEPQPCGGGRSRVVLPLAPRRLAVAPALGAQLASEFLQTPAVHAELQAWADAVLQPYKVVALAASPCAGLVCVALELHGPGDAAQLVAVLRALAGQAPTVSLANGYYGESRFVRQPTGARCTCLDCAPAASCQDGSQDCPCIAGYPGSGEFALQAVEYAEVLPEPVLLPPGVRDRFHLCVLAVDAAGQAGAETCVPGTVDLSVPRAGVWPRPPDGHASVQVWAETGACGVVAALQPAGQPAQSGCVASYERQDQDLVAHVSSAAGSWAAQPVTWEWPPASQPVPDTALAAVPGTRMVLPVAVKPQPDHGVAFECRWADQPAWQPCDLPWQLEPQRRLLARAVNVLGEPDPSPACVVLLSHVDPVPSNCTVAWDTAPAPMPGAAGGQTCRESTPSGAVGAVAFFVAAGWLVVAGLVWALWRQHQQHDRARQPGGSSVRGFRNPMFGQDVDGPEGGLGGRPTISGPTDFRHVAHMEADDPAARKRVQRVDIKKKRPEKDSPSVMMW